MTISRVTEGKVSVIRSSKPVSFGMENHQQIQKKGPTLATANGWDFNEGKTKMSGHPNHDDLFSSSTSPSPSNNLTCSRRSSRVSDYPKATLFSFQPPQQECQWESSVVPQSNSTAERDRNYFSDNFSDISNPVPTRPSTCLRVPPVNGFNNVSNRFSDLSRTTSVASSGSDNEAFSDEGSEPLQIQLDPLRLKNSGNNLIHVHNSEENDQDIRRLTLASDTINPSHTSEQDFDSLVSNMERLRESGWFYENISRHQAKQLLRSKSLGSFIIRESTDPKHLFSLSVRTQRGTTSARIEYTNGRFRLDCEDSIRHHMPVFSCVVKLVNFYIKIGQKGNKPNPCVWLESTGRRDMPVRLNQPVRKEMSSLRHMCRLTIANAVTDAQDSLFPNQEPKMIAKLPLPKPLIQYLQSYPYPY